MKGFQLEFGTMQTIISDDFQLMASDSLGRRPQFNRSGHLLGTANSDSARRSQFHCRRSTAFKQFTDDFTPLRYGTRRILTIVENSPD